MGKDKSYKAIDESKAWRSWFCVFNNPAEHGYPDDPKECVERILKEWTDEHPTRTAAATFCVSAEGLRHCHMVLENTTSMRFSTIKKAFPSAHIEATRGTKEDAEDYINKKGKFEEEDEIILHSDRIGEIKSNRGARKDFENIEDMMDQGMTPNEIMRESFGFRRYEGMIKSAWFDKRVKETPVRREINVTWHFGKSGTGKTNTYTELCKAYGEEKVFLIGDYEKDFDKYNGEPIIFMDEFRGQLKFYQLMHYLEGYRFQIPCRYQNIWALWDKVHISSVFAPDEMYDIMVTNNKSIDEFEQLKRRINQVVYHYKKDEKYLIHSMPGKSYTSRIDMLKHIDEGFRPASQKDREIFKQENLAL